ncbi:MAG: HEAT repeat domain-containing protein, partial [Gammaproteobacteria bacterium]
MIPRAGVTEESSATLSTSGRQGRVGMILVGLLVFLLDSLATGQETTHPATSRSLKYIKGLVSQLSSPNGQTRIQAAQALGRLGADAAPAAPALTQALRDRAHEMRWTAALALGQIGAAAAKATPALLQALDDSSPRVRWTVPGVLVAIQARSERAVPALIRALGDWNPLVRAATAQALSAFGHDGVNALKRALLSPNESVRLAAQQALQKAASAVDERAPVDASRWWSTRQWLTPMWLLLVCYTVWFGIWVLLLERSPQKALQLCQSVKHLERRTHLALTRVLFLGTVDTPRLLDAWVAINALRVRTGFLSRPTVHARRLFVELPVILGNRIEAALNSDALRNLSSFPMRVLIWGEGDSGKTALACRVAEWAVSDDRSQHFAGHCMLPVLIEDEITLYTGRGRHPLVTAIKDHLELTLGRSRPLTDELLQSLLKTGRLLVVIDGFSEMTQQSRQLLDPNTPGFPRINLVITSRQKEPLDTEVVVKTRLLDKDLLIMFLRGYVQQRENTARAREMTIAETARTLVGMANWRRVSPGVAKLYLEQVLGGLKGSVSIPDLIAAYVYQLGEDVASSLATLAWESVRNDLRPMAIPRDRALTRIGGADPGVTLRRLEEGIGMIQTLRPSKFHIRFVLNFIAEYLAAYYLLERNGSAETLWRKFLAQVDSKQGDASARIRPFLSAVLDCLLIAESRYEVPGFVRLELANRLEINVASLVPADVEEAPMANEAPQRKHKSKQYRVAEPRETAPASGAQNRPLSWPTTMVFGTMGVQGVPALLKALNDQDAAVRGAGIDALSQMGAAAHVAIPELIKALDDPDPDIPWRAANALGTMGRDAAAALTNALREKRGEVRRLVVDALGEIGAAAKVAIPVLVQLLERDNDTELRWRAADALGAMGAHAKSAVPVLRRL